jgi:hypothetical protein
MLSVFYAQAKRTIRQQAHPALLPVGEPLREKILSRITVRQALTSLSEESGAGNILAERKTKLRKFEGQIHLSGSLDEIMEMGGDTPVKVIEMNRVEADFPSRIFRSV